MALYAVSKVKGGGDFAFSPGALPFLLYFKDTMTSLSKGNLISPSFPFYYSPLLLSLSIFFSTGRESSSFSIQTSKKLVPLYGPLRLGYRPPLAPVFNATVSRKKYTVFLPPPALPVPLNGIGKLQVGNDSLSGTNPLHSTFIPRQSDPRSRVFSVENDDPSSTKSAHETNFCSRP